MGVAKRGKASTLRIRKDDKGRLAFLTKTKTERILGYLDQMPYMAEPGYKHGAKSIKLAGNSAMAARFIDLHSQIDLTNLVSGDPIHVNIKIDERGMSVMTGDKYHVAYVRDGNISAAKGEEVVFVMDKKLFLRMQELAGAYADEYTIFIDKSAAYLMSDSVRAKANFMQQAEGGEFMRRVKKLVDGMKKTDGLLVPTVDLLAMLDNLDVSDETEKATFSVDKNGKLIVSTGENGKPGYIQTTHQTDLDWDENTTYTINVNILRELLKCKKWPEVQGYFHDDRFFWTKHVDKDNKLRATYAAGVVASGEDEDEDAE